MSDDEFQDDSFDDFAELNLPADDDVAMFDLGLGATSALGDTQAAQAGTASREDRLAVNELLLAGSVAQTRADPWHVRTFLPAFVLEAHGRDRRFDPAKLIPDAAFDLAPTDPYLQMYAAAVRTVQAAYQEIALTLGAAQYQPSEVVLGLAELVRDMLVATDLLIPTAREFVLQLIRLWVDQPWYRLGRSMRSERVTGCLILSAAQKEQTYAPLLAPDVSAAALAVFKRIVNHCNHCSLSYDKSLEDLQIFANCKTQDECSMLRQVNMHFASCGMDRCVFCSHWKRRAQRWLGGEDEDLTAWVLKEAKEGGGDTTGKTSARRTGRTLYSARPNATKPRQVMNRISNHLLSPAAAAKATGTTPAQSTPAAGSGQLRLDSFVKLSSKSV